MSVHGYAKIQTPKPEPRVYGMHPCDQYTQHVRVMAVWEPCYWCRAGPLPVVIGLGVLLLTQVVGMQSLWGLFSRKSRNMEPLDLDLEVIGAVVWHACLACLVESA